MVGERRLSRFGALAVAALVAGLIPLAVSLPPAGAAVTFNVDTTTDLVDPTPGDGVCGSGEHRRRRSWRRRQRV